MRAGWKHLFVAFVAVLALSVGAAEKVKALIVTGDDVGPHPWQETSAATKDILTKSGKFDVTVSEDPLVLEKKDELAKYDEIIFMYYRAKTKAVVSEAGQQNLLDYVKSGKGFVVTHLCSATFNTNPEWNKMVGKYWKFGTKTERMSGHGPRKPFTVKIVDTASPITKGVADFEADDELYAGLQVGNPEIHVLATADSDWSKKTEPLFFTVQYGQGRVVNNCFGHDGKALNNPAIDKLMVQGYEWAATGKVSD